MARLRRHLPRLLGGLLIGALLVGLFAWFAWQQQRLSDRVEALNATLAAQQAHLQDLTTEKADDENAMAAGISPERQGDPEAHSRARPAAAAGRASGDPDAFGLGLLQLALDAIARQDAGRQRALVGFLQNLPDHPFRNQMLALMRDEASDPQAARQAAAAFASAAAAKAQDESTAEPPKAAETDTAATAARTGTAGKASEKTPPLTFGLRHPGRPDGWDYDLLVCRLALDRHDPYLVGEVDRLIESLRQADENHGQIRLRPLSEEARRSDPALGEPGMHVLVDGRRPMEAQHGTQVAKRLAFDGYDFGIRESMDYPTPWQLTLVYCPE